MHGAARINYTAGEPRAHCLVQHVGKWGINNCTGFYCRLEISLNQDYPLTAARLFRNSVTACCICLHLLLHIVQRTVRTVVHFNFLKAQTTSDSKAS
jgi:hypothetical protein